MAETLLVIEDEALFGSELVRHFRDAGWDVVLVGDLAGGRTALLRDGLDPLVVLSDMSLPDGNALDLLEEVRQSSGAAGDWLFLTAYGTVADSVRALRLGAYDFIEKPCDLDRLDLAVAGAARSARAHRRLHEMAAHEHRRYSVDAFVGSSPRAAEVREILRRLVKVPLSALILGGETGTGKGLAARILHYNGMRSTGPLVEVNCAALPRELLESELFGHEPGAFTGAQKRRRGLIEQAGGGTLVLDEISEMAPELQVKLLKVIEDQVLRRLGGEREIRVDIQIIAASNRDLDACVQSGSFRKDLYHRLSVFRMSLPALRERKEDLDDLVPLFVAESASKVGKSVRTVPDAVWSALREYDWPGNVRELRNVIERSVLLSEGETLTGSWLQLPGAGERPAAAAPSVEADRVMLPLDGSLSLEEMERTIIRAALDRAGHNVTAAARLLGTTRQTLRYRIEKHGLAKPSPQDRDP
jgi:DNA-binding NtrC family response regulator